MKTRVPRFFFGAFAVGAFVLLAQNVQSQVLYSDTNTSQNGNYNYFNSEAGNEVVLAGTSFTDLITNFQFQFDFTGSGNPSGNEKADLRFYANNGPLVDGYPSPGTVLYDSGTFSIGGFTSGTVAIFNQTALNGGVVVPQDFTWTVTFSGLSGSENAGLALYSPETIGSSYSDAWVRTNSGSWALQVAVISAPPLDFAALASGAPYLESYSVTNGIAITITNDTFNGGRAINGYASTNVVPAVFASSSALEKVTVTLNGFTHAYPNDVEILLVAPNGYAVALMGYDGGGVGVTNFTLTFDDAPNVFLSTLSTTAPLTNGATYHTGDSSPYGTTLQFPSPAPVTNEPNLTVFNGLLPSSYTGTWSLYVLDDSQPATGSIASWSLNLYTKPVVNVTNTSVTLNEGQSTNFFFTVSDASSSVILTPSISLVVTNGNIGYTNSTGQYVDFISNNILDFTFTPANPTPNGTNMVTITPNANLYGKAGFTINVTDGNGGTASSSNIFLTVSHVPIAPQISLANATITTSNGVASAPTLMSLISLDGNPGSSMALSVVATNVNLGNVGVNSNVFTNTASLSGATPAVIGRTNNFNFTIVPGGFPIGTNYLNFVATDTTPGVGLSATQVVTVIVAPLTNAGLTGPLVYFNTNSLIVPAGPGTSAQFTNITITNLTHLGPIGRISVSLLGLTNILPSSLGLYLVAPDTTPVPLIGAAAGNSPSTFAELTFADTLGTPHVANNNTLPAAGTGANNSVSNYVLNAAAGTAALATALGGHSPTNTGAANFWTLWVTNYGAQPLGISGGWVLDVYPAPVVQEPVQGASFTMTESATTNVVFVTSDTVGTQNAAPTISMYPPTSNYSGTTLATATMLASGASAIVNGTTYTVSNAIVGGTNYTTNIMQLTGNYNDAGTVTITNIFSEANGLPGSTSSIFTTTNTPAITLTVSFVAQPPTIGFIPEQVTFAGDPILNLPFVISSPDTNAANLTVTVSSDNPTMLPTAGNMVVTRGASSGAPPPSPSWQTNYLSLFPVGTKGGPAHITVVVSDGQSTPATNIFLLTVTAPGSPLSYNAAPISISGTNTNGLPYPSTNQVTGLVGTLENVVVTLYGVTYNNDATGLNLLLVGPTNAPGQSPAVYLMGGAGTNAALTNVNLTFSNSLSGPDSGAAVLPTNGLISSTNIYCPTNYRAGAYTTAAPTNAPGPGAGYGANLVTSFKGINPNGTWSLYAFDTNGSKGGLISYGWQLSIITAPNVSPTTTNYSTLENTPTNFVIQVGDAEAANITFTVTNLVTASGSSSQPSITIANPVPVTNNGTVNQAVFSVTPNPYQYGTNNILVVATDASGSASSNNLQFIVTQVLEQPLILVTNVTLSTPAAVPLLNIPFAVWDVQTTNQNTISVSSTGLSPAPVITVVTNGTNFGTNIYLMSIQPVGVGTGSATIVLSVTDGTNQTAKATFTLTVTTNLAFASPGAITMGPGNFGYPVQALPTNYPSTINVSNVAGLVSGVQVELIGFNHNDASDVDVLLQGPNGKTVVLMAGAGNQLPANNVTLQFSQSAGSAIPQLTQLTSGTYLPGNYVSPLVFSNPAPASGYLGNLTSAFGSSSPSGAWNLYVMDTAYPDSGSIASWILFLQTGPALAAIANQTVAENGTINVPLTLTDASMGLSNLTAAISAFTNTANVTVTVQGNGTPSGPTNLLIVPNANYPSSVQNANVTNSITVTVSDTNSPANTATGTFNLIIQKVNQPPGIATPSPSILQIAENGSASITFTFSNVDATLFPSNLSLTCTNAALVAASGITETSSNVPSGGLAKGLPGTVTYLVTPLTNVFGTNQAALIFTLWNTNNLTNTLAVNLNINHVIQNPAIAPFSHGTYSVTSGNSTNIPFSAITFESNATLTISASSGTPAEVPNNPANIIISQTSFTDAVPSTNTGTITIIVPSGTPVGTSLISVTNSQVVGGVTTTGTASFTIQVTASSTTVFANPSSISVNNGVASAYPSTITIAPGALIGNVNGAAVTLNSLSASVPSDVSILLEAPNGTTSVLLLSGAGGTNASSNLTLWFADTNALGSATNALATNGGTALLHATSYNGETNALPGAAPAPPYFDRFAVFNGLSPIGTWSLWVVDTNTGDTVSILNGWTLSISTTPQISLDTNTLPGPLSIPENAAGQNNQGTISYHVVDSTGSSVTVAVTSTNSTLFPSSGITAGNNSGLTAVNGFTNDYTATLTPAALQTGTNTITFTVFRSTDGSSNSVTYPVAVVKSNMAPTMTRLGPITINQNGSNTTEFIVTQIGDPLSTVSVVAYSSNTSVIANSGLTFSTGASTTNAGAFFKTNFVNLSNFASTTAANSGDLILNLAPVASQVGTAVVWIFVTNSDGAFNSPTVISSSFTNTVTPGTFKPAFTNVPSSAVSVIGGNTTNISFQVISADSTAPVVTVSAINQSAPNGETVAAPVSSLGTPLYNGTTSNTAGATWTVAVTTAPTSIPSGVNSIIQLTAIDSNGLTNTTSFQVLAMPGQQHYYSNSAPINIVDVSPSIPSPSTIGVSGLVGLVSQVVVTVNGFAHQYPSDVGILLVGPNGSNTVLMNNAGSGVQVTGLNLTFSTNASGPVPAAQALTSGTFLPSDYQPTKPYNFETSGINNSPTYGPTNPPPPPGPYPTNLNVFNGLNPNTNWNLYVQDDSAGDTGFITGGWTLQIFTQPTLQITGLTNITNGEGSANGKTSFVILDDSPAVYATNSFAATSSNTTLLPATNVTFTGSGTAWTANFSPSVNVTGSSLVTIISSNSYGQLASASFLVTVTNVNFPPVVFQPANGSVITIPAGTPSTIALGYSDTGYNTNALVVTAASSALGSQNPIPASSLAFAPGLGTGPSNLIVTPVGLVTGSNSITVTATQPVVSGSSASTTFTVVVAPSTVPLFTNSAPIAISANSAATPYPSQITVSGVGANILKVTATLIGFSHTFPSDVSALLVGPQGTKVMLMSDEGGGIGVSNLRLTFDDAGAAMPPSGPLTSGTNAPATSDLYYVNGLSDITNFTASNAPPYLHALSAFSNSNPNGVWSLYVYDNSTPDTGTISGGWQLNIQTIGPMITPLSPVTMSENTSVTIPFSIASASTFASNITVTAVAGAQVPSNLVASLLITNAGATNETLTITPTANYPSAVTNINGTATITLTLTDTNHNSSTNTFPLTVLYVDIPPAIVLPVGQTNTPANIALAVPFTTSDVQGTTALAVTASMSPSLGTVGITTNGAGRYTLTFTPNGTAGQTTVSVVASDGTVSSTNNLPITVSAGLVPGVTIVSSTNTPENSPISVPITLANVTATFGSSNLVAVASNTNVVASVGITGSGSNFTANITLVPYRSGSSTITISATDQFGTGTGSTTLTVTPVEYPPTLAPIPAASTTVNIPVTVVLNVTDAAAPISSLTYSAAVSATNVVGSVSFSFNGTNEIATIAPAANQSGTAAITINVSDGVTNVYQTFVFTVTKLEFPPTLGPIANTNTIANTPVNVVLNVTDTAMSITNLIYGAVISSTNVIKAVNFSYNGSNEIATIVPATNQLGTSTISINVSDGVTNISQAFEVTVTAAPGPTLAPIANTNTTVNSSVTVVLSVTDPTISIGSLAYSASVSGTGTNLISSVSFVFTGLNELATIHVVANQTGVGIVTISVSDGFTNASQTFAVTVTPVEHAPTLAAIPDTNTTVNTAVNVVLNVADSVTSITNLIYSADISDSTVIKAVNFSFNGTNEIAAIVPVTNKSGVSAITINVSDGVTNVYQLFYVTVTAPTPPTLGPITNQYAIENTALHVPFSVTSPVTPVTNLQFSGSVTPATLVGSFAFSYNGSNEVATITPAANATGLGTVTLSVSDSFTTNSQSFTLQVDPTTLPTLTATPGHQSLTITFTGLPGASYYIQSSTNFTTWTTIATVTANAVTGAVQYVIVIPSGTGEAFYQLAVP